jgi:hypothetical protein
MKARKRPSPGAGGKTRTPTKIPAPPYSLPCPLEAEILDITRRLASGTSLPNATRSNLYARRKLLRRRLAGEDALFTVRGAKPGRPTRAEAEEAGRVRAESDAMRRVRRVIDTGVGTGTGVPSYGDE